MHLKIKECPKSCIPSMDMASYIESYNAGGETGTWVCLKSARIQQGYQLTFFIKGNQEI